MQKQSILNNAGLIGIPFTVVISYSLLLYFITEPPHVSIELANIKSFEKASVIIHVKNDNWFSYKFHDVHIKIVHNSNIIGHSKINNLNIRRKSNTSIKAEVNSSLNLKSGFDLLLDGITKNQTEVEIIAEGRSTWFNIDTEIFKKNFPLTF